MTQDIALQTVKETFTGSGGIPPNSCLLNTCVFHLSPPIVDFHILSYWEWCSCSDW